MTAKTNRVALVTGANKGIGFEVSKQLGEAGCTIILGARDKKLGSEAATKLKSQGLNVEAIELDITKTATITGAASYIEKNYGKLDILVNNAGIISRKDAAPSVTDIDAVTDTLNTNFVGALRVTQAMLPLLKKAEHASIVNVSSGLGSIAQNSDRNWPYAEVKFMGYSASKAALNMMTAQLAYELRNTKIKVNSSDPGYTATDLNDNRGHQTIEEGSAETIRLALLPIDGPTGQYSDKAGIVPW
jgi:NAD(P)-dependent dehydrogenase (short-subunit alcohol dehydrogenase family)